MRLAMKLRDDTVELTRGRCLVEIEGAEVPASLPELLVYVGNLLAVSKSFLTEEEIIESGRFGFHLD